MFGELSGGFAGVVLDELVDPQRAAWRVGHELELAVASELVTQQAGDEAEARNRLADGSANYAAVAAELGVEVAETAETEAAETASAGTAFVKNSFFPRNDSVAGLAVRPLICHF